jgi:O-antigen ligase
MMARDTRPAIWSAYLELAKQHPWLGVGFGRSLPSKTYHLVENEEFRHIDAHAPTHAHNLLLDLTLEVGLIGLAVWLYLHVALLMLAIQHARPRGNREKAWAAAAVALILSMLVKNSTNDLMVFGNALLFCRFSAQCWVWSGGAVRGWPADDAPGRGFPQTGHPRRKKPGIAGLPWSRDNQRHRWMLEACFPWDRGDFERHLLASFNDLNPGMLIAECANKPRRRRRE